MVLASSHRAKRIQHSKLASRQFKSQKQRKISRPLTLGPAAGGVSEAHTAGEPGDSSGPRAPSFPGSGALACGPPLGAWAPVLLQGSRPELGLLRRRGCWWAARSRTELFVEGATARGLAYVPWSPPDSRPATHVALPCSYACNLFFLILFNLFSFYFM
jgi:hypothetical protein